MDSLSQRLKTEKGERTDGFEGNFAGNERRGQDSREKIVDSWKSSLADGHSELRSKLLEHSKSVSDEIDKLRRETAASLDSEVEILRDEKTDRAASPISSTSSPFV